MRRPPKRPVRVEETLLPFLRMHYADRGIVFGSMWSHGNPDTEVVLVGDPQGSATPVSQWVRVRLSVIVRRSDGSGDFAAAQDLAVDIIDTLTREGQTGPILSLDLDSGPMRQEDDRLIFAYATLLLQVRTH